MSSSVDFSNNLQLQNMNDIIYYYNKNMLAYHNNIQRLIQTVQITNTNHNNDRTQPPPPQPSIRSYFQPSVRTPSMRTTSNIRHNRTTDSNRNFFTFIPLSNTSSTSSRELTQIQIQNSTEIIPFMDDMNELRCPISFEDFVVGENITKIKNCGHYFKTAGIMNWLRRSSLCPVCRYDLRDYQLDETTIPSPEEAEAEDVPEIPNTNTRNYRNEITHLLESIIQNIDNELSTSIDFSNNQFIAEYSIEL